MCKMFVNIIFFLFVAIPSSFAKESLLEPAWAHCVHPLHALPRSWGDITSPGFPNGMKTQMQCSWIIDVNPGFRIKVAFHTLNMTGDLKNCYTQFVNIIDIKVGSSVGKYCGTRKPSDYVSQGGKLRIDLQGDTTGQPTKGFKLKFRATKESPGFKTSFSFPDKPAFKSTFTPSKKPGGGGGGGGGSAPKKFNSGGRVDLRRIQGLRDGTITVKPKPKKKLNETAAAGDDKEVEGGDQEPLLFNPNQPKPNQPKPNQPKPKDTSATKKPQVKRIRTTTNKMFRPVLTRAPYNKGQNLYGANRQNSDPGTVVVTYEDEDDEPDINLYLVIGLSVGGVIILIILFIIIKKCFFDKKKKKKKDKYDVNKNQPISEKNSNFDDITMKRPPELFMMEEIVQRPASLKRYPSSRRSPTSHASSYRPYRDMELPMVPSTMPRHSSRAWERSKSTRSHRSGMQRSKSSRSMKESDFKRSRSTRSRAPEGGRTISRAATVDRRRTKSTHSISRQSAANQQLPGSYFDFASGQWVWVAPQPQISTVRTMPANMNKYAEKESRRKSYKDDDSTSSYSDTSYTTSESSYDSRLPQRRVMHSRMSVHPPPYEISSRRSMADDGYHTSKRKKKRNKSYTIDNTKSYKRKEKRREKRKGEKRKKSRKQK